MKTRFILPVLFLISFSLGSFTSCKEPSSGPETEAKDSLVLKFKESDLTSAILFLHSSGVTLPASVSLYRNGDSVQTFLLHRADTSLKDSLLSPSTSYNWQAKLRKTASSFLTSNTVTARTIDTTSHTFTWKLDTLGAAGSVLFDVAIVNDTCVWVVGDIKSQPYSPVDRYNAAMWNGKAWKKFRFLLEGFNGFESVHDLRTIFYTADGKIAVASGGSFSIHQLDGKRQFTKYLLASIGSSTKIWGTTSSNLFIVGTNGSITHYNGSTFTLMESGTTVNLQDVWGTSDNEVWACGWNEGDGRSVLLGKYSSGWKIINQSDPTNWGKYPSDQQPTDVYSAVWQSKPGDSLWVGSFWGVFRRGLKVDDRFSWDCRVKNIDQFPPDPVAAPVRIRSTGKNNIWVAGRLQTLAHFNGLTWRTVSGLPVQSVYTTSFDLSKNGKWGVMTGCFGPENTGRVIWLTLIN
ncbi:MAG: hypothetical protein J0L62_16390 [Bacteroidetes bacterium]|nr:hypothetical protein [Bacteroidota bacterium]